MLQQPGMADQLRTRLRQSGLTPEQIRARLLASGYPAGLLDAYLTIGSEPVPEPGAQVLSAIAVLGIDMPAGPALRIDTGFVTRESLPATRIFGVDVFRRTTTQFMPLLQGPVPADYRLGPGDVLVLILTGEVELAYTLQANREGFIVIPQVGQVYVANLTLDQLRDVLYTRLGRVYSSISRSPNATARFDVSVANVRANQVYVVGEVMQPGAYQISSLGTALTAVYAAGGITEQANMRNIRVGRLGRQVASLDLYDYLLRGDTKSDVRLETGDVIFVPVHGTRVEVTGAVVRPAIYEMKTGETLIDLIAAAGGLLADAAVKRINVRRVVPPEERGQEAAARTVVSVPISGSGVRIPPMALADGDVVEVNALPAQPEAYFVSLSGMVNVPGRYPWRQGITLREVMTVAGGPRVGADLREAEIARLPADRSKGQMAVTVRVPLDSSYLIDRDEAGQFLGAPGLAFPAGGSAAEVTLEPFDDVLILRQPDFDLQRTVTIMGEVQFPGFYSLRTKDDRLVDLIQRAGGLTPQAYPDGVEFIRKTRKAGRINVDLREAIKKPDGGSNILLHPGDSLYVPVYMSSVRISGAVNSPGSVLYKEGAGLDYYISAAGGFAHQADEGRVSVRQANGSARTKSKWLFFSSSPTPKPGAEVFVPAKDPTAKFDYVGLLASVAQIVASAVAIVAIAKD